MQVAHAVIDNSDVSHMQLSALSILHIRVEDKNTTARSHTCFLFGIG